MKRMLFNATQSEELRVAIVDGQKLIDLDIEHAGKEQRKSNIYKGVITRIEPSLEAAFVDYGTDRHGFLPFKEIARSYFQDKPDSGRARIQDVIKEGQEVIVQVDKDERGSKGAALTTFISLAGRYLVLMPNNPRGGGVSRRVEGEERNELRDTMAQLEVPNGMSIIARTAGIGRTAEELQWDLNYLIQLWTAIEEASNFQPGAYLIYQESSLVIRAIRDYFSADIGEILIDTADVHEQAVQFMNHVMPSNVNRVKLYQDETPLFSRFQIEHQIESAFSREVRLPSGGAIVIDHTEALVSIDVNSGRSIKGADIEQTAFNTNLEAAEEVARQMRLRDLGGLVVIDFIDMENQRNQRDVENALRDALHHDRARVQMGKISRFGLLELSRQRLRPSLGETNHATCPRCNGTGHIRGIESTALHILRITQEEAMKDNSAIIQVQLPVEAATFLLNEKRADIHKIEQLTGVEVVLIPNVHLETPNYKVTRIRLDDVNEETAQASYKMVELPPESDYQHGSMQPAPAHKTEAMVKGITPATSAPIVAEPVTPVVEKPSLLARIKAWFGTTATPEVTEAPAKPVRESRDGGRDRNKNRHRRDRERNRGDRLDKSEKSERGQEAQHARNKPQEKTSHDKSSHDKSGLDRAVVEKQSGRESRAERGQTIAKTEMVAADSGKSGLASPDMTLRTEGENGEFKTERVEARGEPRGERSGRRNRHGRRDRRQRDDQTAGQDNAVLASETSSTDQTDTHVVTDTVVDAVLHTPLVDSTDNRSFAPIDATPNGPDSAQASAPSASVAEALSVNTNDEIPVETDRGNTDHAPATDSTGRGRSRYPRGRNKRQTGDKQSLELVETAATPATASTEQPAERTDVTAPKKKPGRKPKTSAERNSAADTIQLVETVVTSVSAEPTAPKAPRKTRQQSAKWKPADAAATDAPLVMVETQKTDQ